MLIELRTTGAAVFGILINSSALHSPPTLPPSSAQLASLPPLFRNNKGAGCVCEFLPQSDLRRTCELWAHGCRMKEIFLKLPVKQLSTPGLLKRIWFMFNFPIFLFHAPDSWTMTRTLCCLLQLQEKDCLDNNNSAVCHYQHVFSPPQTIVYWKIYLFVCSWWHFAHTK